MLRFRDVIVCGGAIQTPALLQRSGIRGVIGTSLAVHPTVKLAARFRDAINVPNDVPVHQVKEFAPDLSFGCSASGPGLVALAHRHGGAEVHGHHACVGGPKGALELGDVAAVAHERRVAHRRVDLDRTGFEHHEREAGQT